LPFLLAGEPLLRKLFGADFAASNSPLLMLCAGGILYSALGPAIIVLNMTGYERRVTRAFFISLAILLLLIMPLVRFYGAMGAAATSALAMVVGNGLMWRDARRYLSLDTSLLCWLSQRSGKHA
jgi:O-antigen/teichoic acid export membrane protein